jgi:hypothetical protein
MPSSSISTSTSKTTRSRETLAGKYLPTESIDEGYLVVFDTQKRVGAECKPEYYPVGDRRVTGFIIAIGR